MVAQDLRKAMNNRNGPRSPVQTRPTAADIASRPGIDLLRMTFGLDDYRISCYVVYIDQERTSGRRVNGRDTIQTEPALDILEFEGI